MKLKQKLSLVGHIQKWYDEQKEQIYAGCTPSLAPQRSDELKKDLNDMLSHVTVTDGDVNIH